MPTIKATLGLAITTLTLLACAPDDHDVAEAVEPAAMPAMSVATTTTNNNAGACAKVKAVKVADAWRTCTWDGKSKKPVACAKWSPSISDRCTAELAHSGVNPNFSYFGEVDCRSSDRSGSIRRIVIHNGDHAANNNENWKCRPSAAHYTVDRNGEIYQHMGEERAAWHANTENDDTIGIELAIKRKYGGTCNSLPDLAKVAKAEGITEEDVVADLCGPSKLQYEALADLVADIETRHTIVDGGIFGHCEVKATDHGDPKAFNWLALGVPMRKAVSKCGWYHVAAVKAAVTSSMGEKGGARAFLSAGSTSNVEVGDHGYIEDDKENIVAWFVVDSVDGATASAWVPMAAADAVGKTVTLVATPGVTPKPLSGKAAGGAGAPAAKPKLGSCETDYTYWKSGKIKSWTTAADGTVDTFTFDNLGWKHRVCDDAKGMVYVGDASDAYVTDASGTKVRFEMTRVDETTAVAKVFEGKLSVAGLGTNRRVVVRVKK